MEKIIRVKNTKIKSRTIAAPFRKEYCLRHKEVLKPCPTRRRRPVSTEHSTIEWMYTRYTRTALASALQFLEAYFLLGRHAALHKSSSFFDLSCCVEFPNAVTLGA